jgi:Family of unknown function (DUF6624)
MINKALQQKLLKMMKIDQNMRFGHIKNKKPWNFNIDKNNTIKLKKIIKQYGWPGIPMVGKKGSVAAWILAQHADHDLQWQKRCLKMMQTSYAKNNVEGKYLALLTDRVLLASGKWQLYGTQYRVRNKKLNERPIKDRKNLGNRRKKMGLDSFTTEKKMMMQHYKKYNK